jgi:uncharacterized protein YbjT (DUF2867 family)
MHKVLLFGATGNVGRAIAQELVSQGYDLTVVVRHEGKAASLASIAPQYLVAEVSRPAELADICQGFEVVISALGKSVSPNDWSKPSFADIDLGANSAILAEAVKAKVKKFVYVSALHAERYLHLEYFRVHHVFSERLMASGLNYSIIKPPAVFSAFVDLIVLAKKGQLVTLGQGDKRTNPICESDLARLCVQAIKVDQLILEAGGKQIYSRRELNEIVQGIAAPNKRVRSLPLGLVEFGLPMVKLINRNLFDKMAFFAEVMQHDTIAPPVAGRPFADYIREKVGG